MAHLEPNERHHLDSMLLGWGKIHPLHLTGIFGASGLRFSRKSLIDSVDENGDPHHSHTDIRKLVAARRRLCMAMFDKLKEWYGDDLQFRQEDGSYKDPRLSIHIEENIVNVMQKVWDAYPANSARRDRIIKAQKLERSLAFCVFAGKADFFLDALKRG